MQAALKAAQAEKVCLHFACELAGYCAGAALSQAWLAMGAQVSAEQDLTSTRATFSETRRAHESLTKTLEAEKARAEEAAKELKQARADAAAAKKVRSGCCYFAVVALVHELRHKVCIMSGQAEAGLRKAVKKAEAAAAAAKEYADSFHQEAHRNWLPHWLDERINEVDSPRACGFTYCASGAFSLFKSCTW